MTNSVQIKITGHQQLGEEWDETVVYAEGSYEQIKDLHRIEYDEKQEDGIIIHNVICVSARGVKIEKRGSIVSDMFLVPGKIKEVTYQTPYGTLTMEARCKRVDIMQEDKELHITMEYILYSGGELVSECETRIELTNKRP